MMLALIYATTASGAFYAFTDWTGHRRLRLRRPRRTSADLPRPELFGALVNTLFLAFGFLVLTNVLGLLLRPGPQPQPEDPLPAAHPGLHAGGPRADRGVLRLEVHLRLQRPAQPDARPRSGWTSWQQDWLADPTLALIWRPGGDGLAERRLRDGHLPGRAGDRAASSSRRPPRSTAPAVAAGSGTSPCRPSSPSVGIATTLDARSRACASSTRSWPSPAAARRARPQTLATEVYQQTFVFGNFGFGAALALLLSVMILVFRSSSSSSPATASHRRTSLTCSATASGRCCARSSRSWSCARRC